MKLVAEDVGGDEEEEKWLLAQAFAKDSRSTTWPPRSYRCTFCRRDFMSAQALGGHMNVHRRDRALLHHHHQAQTLTNYQSAVLGNNENMCVTSFEVVQVKENKLPDHHHHHHQSNNNFTEVSSVPIEEIDLELRLGYL